MAHIGIQIKSRREQLRMTQEELAKKLGYKSKSTINKIEMGINDISQTKIKAFADALDTSISYLMDWEHLDILPVESGVIIPVLGRVCAGNGSDAMCKRLQRYSEGFALIPENPTYEPIRYTNEDISEIPVRIIGKVVESRRKY